MKKLIFVVFFFSFLSVTLGINCFAQNNVNDYLKIYPIWSEYGGSGGGPFDLSSGMPDVPGAKISSITVSWDNSYIGGIQLDYTYEGSSSTGTMNREHKQKVNLGLDEYIIHTDYYKNKYHNSFVISRLKFVTNKGRTIWFGQNNPWVEGAGGDFSSSGWSLAGLKGKSGTLIDSLQNIIYMPLKLEYVDMTFGTPDKRKIESTFLADTVGINKTEVPQSSQFRLTFTKTTGSTDTWTSTAGISATMGVKVGAKAGVKSGIFNAEISQEWSYSFSASFSETIGSTTSNTTSESSTTVNNINVPAKSIYALKTVVFHEKGIYPYTIRYRNTYDQKIFTTSGEIDANMFVRNFVQWLDIGYVDSNGNCIIYPEYQDEYSGFPMTRAQTFDTKGNQLDTSNTISINSLSIDMNDPNWKMSDGERQFRYQNNLN
ncbi:MAG: hypothetical protein GY710_01360 [Desulfobacteraceae bacterium]|nr:hypothetical protein [Desulfobacteraceae bacterium]